MNKPFSQPIFNFAKSQVNKESIDIIKQQIIFYVDKQIEKYETLISTYDSTDKRAGEVKGILSKYIIFEIINRVDIRKKQNISNL